MKHSTGRCGIAVTTAAKTGTELIITSKCGDGGRCVYVRTA